MRVLPGTRAIEPALAKCDVDAIVYDRAGAFIAEAVRRGLGAVAVTDHHDGAFPPTSWPPRSGSGRCWARPGEPTVEALRQACLAHAARIPHGPPQRPANRVVGIEIRSSITGTDLRVILVNEGFTGFIGGRGSGKSAVLEFLRFGLGKSERDVGQEEASGRRSRARERSLIEETLVCGWAAVELDGGGLRERWMWTGDAPATITKRGR